MQATTTAPSMTEDYAAAASPTDAVADKADNNGEDARQREEAASAAAALAGTLRAVFDHMAASATLRDSASLTFELGLAPGVLLL